MLELLNASKDPCGYSIEEWRKELWRIELRLSLFLDGVCKENHLSYFLIGGGAIGAERHKGFIPWDDDLDFGMKRDQFDKLVTLLKTKYKDCGYAIQYGTHGNFVSFLLRIRDTNSTGLVLSEKKYSKECHGVFIEIYPFDNVPNSFLLKKKQQLVARFLTGLLSAKMDDDNKCFSYRLLRFLGKHTSSSSIWRKLIKNSIKYNKKQTRFVDTPSLSHYYSLGIHHFLRMWIDETHYAPFEKIELPICSGNYQCLELQYGDFLELPPLDQRGKYHEQAIYYDPYHIDRWK